MFFLQVLSTPELTTGISENIREVQFSCFPNPASEKLTVKFNVLQPSKIKIVLAAMNGSILDSKESTYISAGIHSETFKISNNIASQLVQLIVYVDDVPSFCAFSYDSTRQLVT
jgi:alcohol dehydrogenase YqhD (iron-dependent ADH family)